MDVQPGDDDTALNLTYVEIFHENPPEGFERRMEYRWGKEGEFYLREDGRVDSLVDDSRSPLLILKPIEMRKPQANSDSGRPCLAWRNGESECKSPGVFVGQLANGLYVMATDAGEGVTEGDLTIWDNCEVVGQ